MIAAFDRAGLSRNLDHLVPAGRLAFGLGCAERMWPNYVAFSREQGWGDAGALRAAFDAGWRRLAGAAAEPEELARIAEHIDQVTPDTEAFDALLTSSALDAACAARHVLDFLNSSQTASIVAIASLAIDSVDLFVQETEKMSPQDPALERRILEHPLMQAELERQDVALRALRSAGQDGEAIRRLALSWRRPDSSVLGLTE